jgi:putative ABC transport system permease protein
MRHGESSEPNWRRYLRFWRRDAVADVDDELRFHFASRVAEFEAEGMSRPDAIAAARARFGDFDAVREDLARIDARILHGSRMSQLLDAALHDVGYAFRRLRGAPGVSASIVLTLSLGIGANAAVLSLVDALLINPPSGVARPEMLRRLYARSNWSVGDVTEIHQEIGVPQFGAIASALGLRATLTAYTKPDSIVVGRDEDRGIALGSFVDASFFPLLGVRFERGRPFDGGEDDFAKPAAVAIISYSYWQAHFHGDPSIVGIKALLDRRLCTIIGVTAKGFRGPDLVPADVWLPLASPFGDPTRPWYQAWRSGRRVRSIARLTPGTPEALVGSIATAAFRHGELEHVSRHPDTATVVVGPILESLGPSIRPRTDVAIILRLIGVSLALLLVACANVANLLLARALARRREIAVRMALGVSRARLASQLLVESGTLALLAGVAGALIAVWSREALGRMILPGTALAGMVWDWRIVVLALALAMVTGLLSGLAPAAHMVMSDVAGALRGDDRQPATAARRLRQLLIVAQTALSLVLIVGSGLFLQSLRQVRSIDLGYDVDRLVWAIVAFYDPQQHAIDYFGEGHAADLDAGMRESLAQLERVPGVESAALASNAPMEGYAMIELYTDTGSVPRLRDLDPALISATPSYFNTGGVTLRRGRLFGEADDIGAPPVVVVNETAAKTYWPNRDALGQCLRIGRSNSPCSRVIGITKDSHMDEIIEERNAEVFVPSVQQRGFLARPSYLVVRAQPGEVAHVAETIRKTLRARFPQAEPPIVRTAASVLEPELQPWRLGMLLFASFGALAVVVAGIGVFSAMAYVVNQRSRELGIRAALGARRARLVAIVVVDAMRMIGAGILTGVALALLAGRLVATLLYATSPHDPIVMVTTSVGLILVGIAASAVPAWRASGADPMDALRAE